MLAGGELEAVRRGLSQLCRANVLHELAAGYAFVHRDVQRELAATLPKERACSAHLRLARAIGDADSRLESQLLASLHYLYAGEFRTGAASLARACMRYEGGGLMRGLRPVMPIIEAAYVQLKQLDAPAHALATPAVLLALAGYWIDRRYGAFGEEALMLSDEVLQLSVYRRLRRHFGAKLALLAALVCSLVRALPHRAYALPVTTQVASFIGMASCMNSLAATARGHLEILRGNHARGIAILDNGEIPLASCGWAQTRGMLAQAHNALGEHARAREICQDALTRLAPADLGLASLLIGRSRGERASVQKGKGQKQ